MLLLCIAGLISFSPGVLGANYKLEGHLSRISAEQIEGKENRRGLFLELEQQIQKEIENLLEIEEFFVSHFELHGQLRTPIFTAFLNSNLPRNHLLQAISLSKDLNIFFLQEIDYLPGPPTILSTGFDGAVQSCANGGVLLPNSTCACPPFFKGDRCQNVICLHRGIQENSRCTCPPGVYSMNCEPRACLPSVQETLDISSRSFVLVLNTKSSMGYVLNTLIFNLEALLNDVSAVNKIQNYILVTYVNGANYDYVKPSVFNTSSALMNYLYSVVHISDGFTLQKTNYAITVAETFTSQIKAFSNIFVFTDSLDSDAKPANYSISTSSVENTLILQTNAWRHRILYLISQQKSSPVDSSGDPYGTYKRVAQATMGDVVSYDVMEISQILRPLIYSYTTVEFIEARYGASSAQTISIFPDDPSQAVHVLVTVDPSGTLPMITNQNGQALQIEGAGSRFALLATNFSQATSLKVTPQNGSPWSLKVFIASSATALIAYSTDPQIDIGDSFTFSELSSTASIAPIGLSGPALLSWKNSQTGASIFAGTLTQSRAQECTFPLTATPKATCTPGPFIQYLTLKSRQRNVVRVLPGFCGAPDHPVDSGLQCLNGGQKKGVNSCSCPSMFTGHDCSVPVCVNGGSSNQFPGNGFGLCNCPTGFSGDHCEILACKNPSETIFYNQKRSFALILQNSNSQAQLGSSIQQGLAVMMGLLADDNDSFNEYVFTTFTYRKENGIVMPEVSTNNYNSAELFSTAVNSTVYFPSPTSTTNSFDALLTTMQSTTYDRSSFFLFVDSPSNSSKNEMEIAMTAIQREFEINIIITPQYNMSDLCISDHDAAPYIKVAQMTGGVIYNLCKPYGTFVGDPVVEFFRSFGVSHHHTENVAEGFSPSCAAPTVYDFFVDDPTAQHFLIVNSEATQNFTAVLSNMDDNSQQTLSPISTTPFISVYNLNLALQNTNGYQVKVSIGDGSSYGSCFSRIAEKTTVAVYLGFSTDPSQDAPSKTLTYATKNYPVIHISTPSDGQVQIDAYDDRFDDFYTANDTKRASSCRYESYFEEPFICDSLYGTFVLFVKTKTPNGTVIQRSRRALCYIEDGQCLNGGTYSNGQCHCPEGYLSPHCEFPRCQNGGEVRDYQCICGPNLAGPLCQYETCPNLNYMEDVDPRESNFKQITFVVNTNADQTLVNVYLASIIQQFVDDTETPDVPKQYSLIVFDEQTVTNVASTTNAAEFVSIFKNIGNYLSPTTGQPTKSLEALIEAFKINIDPPAIIFLVTGSDAARSSVTSSILQQRIGTQVNVIYTPSNTEYPGQPGGSYGAYLSIAVRQTGGRIWPLTPSSILEIEPALASTINANALVFDDAEKDCSAGASFSFESDILATKIFVDITGIDVNQAHRVTISNNIIGSIAIKPSMILMADSAALLLGINHQPYTYPGGTWTVTVKTTSGSCFVQVRTQSPVRLVPGFTSSKSADFVKELPFSQYGTTKEAYMTFRLVDRGDSDNFTTVSSVDIISTDFDKPWLGRKALGHLAVFQRDPATCASQYVSELWGLDSPTFQKFVVSGADNKNNRFQRTFFYAFNKPSAADNAATCQNGQRKSNGECLCDLNHTGDFCAARLCQNGGSQSFGICVCRNGYYGDYCEKLVTTSTGTTTTMAPVGTTSAPIATSTSQETNPPGTSTAVVTASTGTTTATVPVATTTVPIVSSTSQETNSPSGSSTAGSTTTTVASTGNSVSNLPGETTTDNGGVQSSTVFTTISSSSSGTTTSAGLSSTNIQTSTQANSEGTGSTIPSTLLTTTAPSSSSVTPTTVEITTEEMTTDGSTTTGVLLCDPYTTTYMVSIFFDATNMFDDPGMSTLYKGENLIAQSLAQKLYLGNGMANPSTRFVLSSVASTFQTVGNVTDQAMIPDELANLVSPQGADLIYNLTNALEQYQSNDTLEWEFGSKENPPLAIVLTATELDGDIASTKIQLDELANKGYKLLAVNLSPWDNVLESQLVSLFTSANVYDSINAEDTATWLRNKICRFKPF